MDRLELPNGETIEPGEVILFEGYAYRYEGPADAGAGDGNGRDRDPEGFRLAPIHWGDSDLDLRFSGPADLRDRWGPDSRGRLTADEWRAWLEDARTDPGFVDAELDAIESAVLPDRGPLYRLRRLF